MDWKPAKILNTWYRYLFPVHIARREPVYGSSAGPEPASTGKAVSTKKRSEVIHDEGTEHGFVTSDKNNEDDEDNYKKPKRTRWYFYVLILAVILSISSLFFYNNHSGKNEVSRYQLGKPVPEEVALPLQDSGIIQFTKFLQAEAGGNLDTVMAFFSPNIVRFHQLLAPNLDQVENYYRDKWSRALYPVQTLQKVQKINRRTYIFTIIENTATMAGMSGNDSHEVVKRVIFNNHYRILSIKAVQPDFSSD